MTLVLHHVVIHYVDDIILTGSDKQEVNRYIWGLDRTHYQAEGGKLNPTEIWDLTTSVKVLGAQWSGTFQDTPPKEGTKSFFLYLLLLRREHRFWEK